MTMTCVSPRSGIASRCMWVSDHHPKTQPTATARKTAALLRIDHSMIREITAEISPVRFESGESPYVLLSQRARQEPSSCGGRALYLRRWCTRGALTQPRLAGGFLNPPGTFPPKPPSRLRGQSFHNLHPVIETPPNFDFPLLKMSRRGLDEDLLRQSRIHDGVGRHREAGRESIPAFPRSQTCRAGA